MRRSSRSRASRPSSSPGAPSTTPPRWRSTATPPASWSSRARVDPSRSRATRSIRSARAPPGRSSRRRSCSCTIPIAPRGSPASPSRPRGPTSCTRSPTAWATAPEFTCSSIRPLRRWSASCSRRSAASIRRSRSTSTRRPRPRVDGSPAGAWPVARCCHTTDSRPPGWCSRSTTTSSPAVPPGCATPAATQRQGFRRPPTLG